MSQRLQVLLDEEEFDEIREIARDQHLTVSEWVRRSLREARRLESRRSARAKLDVIAKAAHHSFPSGEIESMLEEIERGYSPS